MKSISKLNKMISQFLSETRKSVAGGWADISDEDMIRLDEIIYKLIELKCQKDADGDYPINYSLVNRRIQRFAIRPSLLKIDYNPTMRQIASLAVCAESLCKIIRIEIDSRNDKDK